MVPYQRASRVRCGAPNSTSCRVSRARDKRLRADADGEQPEPIIAVLGRHDFHVAVDAVHREVCEAVQVLSAIRQPGSSAH